MIITYCRKCGTLLRHLPQAQYCRECILNGRRTGRRRDSGQIALAGRPGAAEILAEIVASVPNVPLVDGVEPPSGWKLPPRQ